MNDVGLVSCWSALGTRQIRLLWLEDGVICPDYPDINDKTNSTSYETESNHFVWKGPSTSRIDRGP